MERENNSRLEELEEAVYMMGVNLALINIFCGDLRKDVSFSRYKDPMKNYARLRARLPNRIEAISFTMEQVHHQLDRIMENLRALKGECP